MFFTKSPSLSPSQQPNRTALYVLLIYMACQLSSFILVIIPPLARKLLSMIDAPTRDEKLFILSGYWSTGAFAVALLLIMIIILRDKNFWNVYSYRTYSTAGIIGWGILGFFMIYFGQIIGSFVEMAFGIEAGSENTAQIGEMMKATPIMILAVAVLGPILEELVFRRVIFGTLIKKYNFWISAIVSGVVFAAIHLEFEHIILYSICGLVFAYLYHKTQSIWTSIIAHVLLNTSVSIIQLNYDKINDWAEKQQQLQTILFYLS
jgi:uncharacterized protein